MSDESNFTAQADSKFPWRAQNWQYRSQLLLNSYEKWVGRPLIPRVALETDAQKLFLSPVVVVGHGTEDDPLLNFGNQAALILWEMSLNELLATPSRRTAETVHRSERAELLRRTKKYGFIDDYSGIRISSSGHRFLIHNATVWNVVDSQDTYLGQAAAFERWDSLAQLPAG